MLVVDSPFIRRSPRQAPSWRLLCIPYAGAGASIYNDWPKLLPAGVEVLAVQLPGREDRYGDRFHEGVEQLVRALARAVRPYSEIPIAFYGHCAGALLAFELAQELEQSFAAAPDHLFLSAQAPPHIVRAEAPIHALSDHDFRAELRRREAADPVVLDDDELMTFLLPRLRADFELWENYRSSSGKRVSSAISVFGGRDDRSVSLDELLEWERYTTAGFEMQVLDGGHFFMNRAPDQILEVVCARMAGVVSRERTGDEAGR